MITKLIALCSPTTAAGTTEIDSRARFVAETYPILSSLGVSQDEFVAISLQGSVQSSKRGTKTIYRLRFRFRGRQRARYVSPRVAAALELELQAIQKVVRAQRQLNRVARVAHKVLRDHKRSRTPLLEARGYHYHGHQVRRRRKVT